MRVAITGETGFLGYHLKQYLQYQLNYDVIELSRNYQLNIHLLSDCDWLIHCSGVNRSNSVRSDNIQIAEELIELLKSNQIACNIAYTSSTQELLGTEYGIGKLRAGEILNQYCLQTNKKFLSYQLPNLFGPFGKPNYNSVVATFCYNVCNNITCRINENEIKLCYVYDAIKILTNFEENNTYNTIDISVSDLYKKIIAMHGLYCKGTIPELNTKFDIDLFNTYRSYMNNVHEFIRNTDERGYLVEILKSKCSESQVFFSTTLPGVVRGNHFHFHKVERFCVLKGNAKISLRKLGSAQIISYIVNEGKNTMIDIPVLHTHNITNIGDSELLCVFWTNEIFDKENSDTYFIQV
jgi:UDP-2-acetamido-2,6-beta-L-arabino-hexul-4-ose reductase